jgi:hypothetical protein
MWRFRSFARQFGAMVYTLIVVALSIPLLGDAHPWKALAGSWRDSPDREAIERNLQEYRQQVDADPDRL